MEEQKNQRDLTYYLGLPWTFIIKKQAEGEDSFYLARIAELERCICEGRTPIEALENLQEALKLHIENELAVGNELPEPGYR